MGRFEYDRKVRTYCPSPCVLSCGMFAYVKDGRIVKIEPAPIGGKGDEYICAKGLACLQGLIYHPDRLKYPLKRVGKRGEGKWQRISWDEALDLIAHGFKEIRDQYGAKAIMGFEGILVHALGYCFAGRLANLLECTYTHIYTAGDSAGPIANLTTYGSFGGGHETRDTVNSKFFILWGLNPAETQPVEMRDFLDAKERGTKLVVIDPRLLRLRRRQIGGFRSGRVLMEPWPLAWPRSLLIETFMTKAL